LISKRKDDVSMRTYVSISSQARPKYRYCGWNYFILLISDWCHIVFIPCPWMWKGQIDLSMYVAFAGKVLRYPLLVSWTDCMPVNFLGKNNELIYEFAVNSYWQISFETTCLQFHLLLVDCMNNTRLISKNKVILM
jgi:hypothetical protein